MGTHQLFGQVSQSDVTGLPSALDGKAALEHDHLYAGLPFVGEVPAGSATPSIAHNLDTLDVHVAVYRTADGLQVGVPSDRIDTNTVQLIFTTAPTAGQYRVVVSAGTGSGGGAGGGGGAPAAHASTHAEGGSDPVTPASIGAAEDNHTHAGIGTHAASHAEGGSDPVSPASIGAAEDTHNHDAAYAASGHSHPGDTPIGGATGQVLTKDSGTDYDYSWQDVPDTGGGATSVKPYPPVNLTDATTVSTNALDGTHFRLIMSGNRTLAAPSNPTDGQIVLWEVTANAANRTLTLAVDAPGAFAFGSDITALSATVNGQTDYIQAVYDARASGGTGRWRVISYVKGFPG